MERKEYTAIKNAIECDFIDYMDEEQLTVVQTTLKIIEEDSRKISIDEFVKYGYILNIAIESLKKGEIADFIFEQLDNSIHKIKKGISEDEKKLLYQDLSLINKYQKNSNYKVVETSVATKMSVDYLLHKA